MTDGEPRPAVETPLPAIEATYTDEGTENRSATCRFENDAQLRVRELDDERVAVEVFRPDESLIVDQIWTERTAASAEERLESLAAAYRECRRWGDPDALRQKLPHLAVVFDEP